MGKEKEKKRKREENDERDVERKKQKKEKKNTILGYLGYSNDCNPFGDTNITSRFVWKKKVEQELSKGRDPSELTSKAEKQRIQALAADLEKAKARRTQREREKQLWEEEMARLEKERNQATMESWESKEAQFHLEQAKTRSEIRIREGREKPIDIIYKNLNLDANYELDTRYPYEIFNELSLNDLEELRDEILVYLELDATHSEFWRAMIIVCDAEIDKFYQKNNNNNNNNNNISSEIHDLYLNDKTLEELVQLEEEAKNVIDAGGAVDVEFWETVLNETVTAKAKAKLREIHSKTLQQSQAKRSSLPSKSSSSSEQLTRNNNNVNNNNNSARGYRSMDANKEENQNSFYQKSLIPTSEDDMLKYELEKGMAENEEVFTGEIDLAKQNYSWNDLYRPRKPKYYNRVKTGYEWNKYNQTHYDHDNPPPKIVQGYKFNIFYPDLIDKSKAPTFHIEKVDGDTSVIRFHAGPPYEDIAFRIVNREWESSHKKGYKCVFDKGILQLWFNFKRFRYRR